MSAIKSGWNCWDTDHPNHLKSNLNTPSLVCFFRPSTDSASFMYLPRADSSSLTIFAMRVARFTRPRRVIILFFNRFRDWIALIASISASASAFVKSPTDFLSRFLTASRMPTASRSSSVPAYSARSFSSSPSMSLPLIILSIKSDTPRNLSLAFPVILVTPARTSFN